MLVSALTAASAAVVGGLAGYGVYSVAKSSSTGTPDPGTSSSTNSVIALGTGFLTGIAVFVLTLTMLPAAAVVVGAIAFATLALLPFVLAGYGLARLIQTNPAAQTETVGN